MISLSDEKMCEVFASGEDNVGGQIGCAVLMEMAGAPWAFGISMAATPFAGYVFELGWQAFSAWVCSHV